MDPNATLDAFFNATTEGEALAAAVDLLTWLAHKGAAPKSFTLRMLGAPAKLDELAGITTGECPTCEPGALQPCGPDCRAMG